MDNKHHVVSYFVTQGTVFFRICVQTPSTNRDRITESPLSLSLSLSLSFIYIYIYIYIYIWREKERIL